TLSVPKWNNLNVNGPFGNSSNAVNLGSATTQGTINFTGSGTNAVTKGLVLAAGGGKVKTNYPTSNPSSQYIKLNSTSGITATMVTGTGPFTIDTSNGNGVNTARFIFNTGTLGAVYTGPTTVLPGGLYQFNTGGTINTSLTMSAGSILQAFGGSSTTTIPV